MSLYTDPRERWYDEEFTLLASGLFEKHGFNDGEILEDIVSECSSCLPSEVLVKAVRKYLVPALNIDLEIYEPNTSHNPIRAKSIGDNVLSPKQVTITGRQVLDLCYG